jgi:radical SAM-linked protein
MYRFRIEYSKEGPVAYVSHLDLNRMFERAARRAQLPVALSQGYHPHYRFSFGSVLPVGMEGEREYLDVELGAQKDKRFVPEEIQRLLERQMPLGIKIRRVREIPLEAPGLMALIDTACYLIWVRLLPEGAIQSAEEFQQVVDQALKCEAWPIIRTNDKGSKEINARLGLAGLDLSWEQGLVQGNIWMNISSQVAVRPGEVLDSLEQYGGLVWDRGSIRIRRTGLFVTRNGERQSPLEIISKN